MQPKFEPFYCPARRLYFVWRYSFGYSGWVWDECRQTRRVHMWPLCDREADCDEECDDGTGGWLQNRHWHSGLYLLKVFFFNLFHLFWVHVSFQECTCKSKLIFLKAAQLHAGLLRLQWCPLCQQCLRSRYKGRAVTWQQLWGQNVKSYLNFLFQ